MKYEDRLNYPIILMVILLIGVYSYYSNKLSDARSVIIKQQDAISSQKQLIDLYNIYYLHPKNSPIYEPQKPIIKQPI